MRAARAEFNGAMLELEDAKRKAESRVGRLGRTTAQLPRGLQRQSKRRAPLRSACKPKKALKAGTARVTDVLLALAQGQGRNEITVPLGFRS